MQCFTIDSATVNLRKVSISDPIIFRTGSCETISEDVANCLVGTGVQHFIDLRSSLEPQRFGDPINLTDRGIRHVHFPLAG
jgi:hypothetical protein